MRCAAVPGAAVVAGAAVVTEANDEAGRSRELLAADTAVVVDDDIDGALVSAQVVRALGEFLAGMTETSRDTGWRAAAMVVSYGVGVDEVVVGVRWAHDRSAYVAEIR